MFYEQISCTHVSTFIFFVHYICHLIYVNHDFGQFDDEADVRVDSLTCLFDGILFVMKCKSVSRQVQRVAFI